MSIITSNIFYIF